MKVKCPCCHNTFEAIEHPAPIITKGVRIHSYASSNREPRNLQSQIYGATLKKIGVGLSSVSSVSQSSIDTNKPLPTGTMKKGYKEIFETIDNHQGATWTELKMETNLSTATLSKRLTEGKQAGIIDEEIRKPEGKKVYIKG
jgi:hypothetical protein